jgi:hypothetical protein
MSEKNYKITLFNGKKEVISVACDGFIEAKMEIENLKSMIGDFGGTHVTVKAISEYGKKHEKELISFAKA